MSGDTVVTAVTLAIGGDGSKMAYVSQSTGPARPQWLWDLQMPWHDLARVCCTELCHSKVRLFITRPPPPSSLDQPRSLGKPSGHLGAFTTLAPLA